MPLYNTVSSIFGSSIVGQLPAGTATLGAVTAVAGSIASVTFPAGSVGAVLAQAPAGSVMTTAQLAGSLLAVTVRSGSTLAFAPAGSLMAVVVNAGSIISNAAAGSILSVSAISGSVIATAPAGSIMATNQVAGSILYAAIGSVAATIVDIDNSSIITVFSQSPSIVGTYAEDAAHTAADKGVFMLGVRNDAITSISGADRDYTPIAMDEASRQIIVPFAGTKACIISYVGSTVSGSVQLIQASVIGSKSYITDFWLSNTGATTTLVTFQDGTTSIMGQFIAPAGGGMSSPGLAIPLKPVVAAGSDLAFKVSPSTSVLYVVVKGYQAP